MRDGVLMDGEREADAGREYLLEDDRTSPPPMVLTFDLMATGGGGEDFPDELSVSRSEPGRIVRTEEVRRKTSAMREDHFGLGLELLIAD